MKEEATWVDDEEYLVIELKQKPFTNFKLINRKVITTKFWEQILTT